MADQDTQSALGAKSETLLQRLTQNRDLTNAFMAMLWMIANTASERGSRMDGIEIDAPTITENRIRFRVHFHSISLASHRYISVEARNLGDHIGRENAELWTFIRANPTIYATLEGIIERMEGYARDKGVRFSELQFSNGFMDDEDCFVLVLINPRFKVA